MRAIGINSVLGITSEVPVILHDLMKAMERGGDLSEINLSTPDADPSAIRDTTDPIYQECWWRAEVPVGGEDSNSQLTRLYHVSYSILNTDIPC
jgi:hypothetical protein